MTEAHVNEKVLCFILRKEDFFCLNGERSIWTLVSQALTAMCEIHREAKNRELNAYYNNGKRHQHPRTFFGNI